MQYLKVIWKYLNKNFKQFLYLYAIDYTLWSFLNGWPLLLLFLLCLLLKALTLTSLKIHIELNCSLNKVFQYIKLIFSHLNVWQCFLIILASSNRHETIYIVFWGRCLHFFFNFFIIKIKNLRKWNKVYKY